MSEEAAGVRRGLLVACAGAPVWHPVSGKLLVMSREEEHGYIYQSTSIDGGYTWSPAQQLPFWDYPIHCIRLADGRMGIVYGRRKEPFGIRGAISEDEGRSGARRSSFAMICPMPIWATRR